MSFTQDNRGPLNVTPTQLVVPPSLEAAGLHVVNAIVMRPAPRTCGGARRN
ncbi:Mu-like prophage major head subunit gpT family protein [Humitalea sp. 24SJ18S-53]|uniref:Mu-like prophage major head subunit gpT family protein n=1 Tax=Humitalea sp. 24SJ18S-53 TaxID=3422307 RepID=UPI003D6661F5